MQQQLEQHQQQQQEQEHQQEQQEQNGSAPAAVQHADCAVFAPVVGGALEAERERSAKAAAERDVAGEPHTRHQPGNPRYAVL